MIFGYTGSTAEEFAVAYGHEFVALDSLVLTGDLNGDGTLSIADTVMMFRLAIEDADANVDFSSITLTQVDIDGDGLFNIDDVVKALQFMRI